MSQINPEVALEKGWFIPGPNFDKSQQMQQIGIDVTVNSEMDLVLRAKDCMNLMMSESVNLPANVYADLKQRSSFSRMGVFITNGFYDPGYHGVVGLTIYNMNVYDIPIPKGSRIAQMVFYDAQSASLYDGTYNHTDSIESKYANTIEEK